MTLRSASSPKSVVRESSGNSTAERLLTEAAALFRERGYASTTTRQLGDALGIRGASLYHHIASKEVLLYDICLIALKQITDDFLALASDDDVTVDRLHALFVAHMDGALSQRDLHATMLTEFRELSVEHRQKVVELRAQYEELWRRQLSAGQAKGLIRSDIDVRYLTLSLLNLLNWTIFWYEPTGPMTPADLADLFFKVYVEGVHGS